MDPIIITFLIFSFIIIGIVSIVLVLKSPFKYPYYYISLDVSGRRQPNIYDLIDEHLNKYGLTEFYTHQRYVEQWKTASLERIQNSVLQNIVKNNFKRSLTTSICFVFSSYDSKRVIDKGII